jgi:hypothetical protein
MQTLDRTERQVGYIAAAFAAAMGLLGLAIFPKNRLVTSKPTKGTCTLPDTLNKATGLCEHLVSNQLVLIAGISVAFAVAIALSVRFRRRVPTTFTSLLAGVAFTSVSISVGAPLLIYGGWLFLRARRIQKWGVVNGREVAVLAGEDRKAKREGRTPSRGMTAAEYRAHVTEKRATKGKAKGGTSGPQASKRYTPKSAPKRRPAPEPTEKPPSKWRARLEGLDQEG